MVDFVEASPLRQYTRRARIAQSSALLPVEDEPASPVRDVSQGEACPTDSGFIVDQDRATIAKSSTLPYDSAPRVTFPATKKGSMQQTIPKLTALCTSLQRQLSKLTDKFQAQEVEINQLKERVKQLEERKGVAATNSRDDALIKGRSVDEGEAATERVSDDTEEMATVLTSIDASTVLASGVVDVPTGSRSIPIASTPAEGSVPTGSEEVPTTSPVFSTATVVTPYRRRKEKEVMVESETPKKQKVQEQIDAQKLSEEITKEAKSPKEVIKEKIKEMMQLVPIEEVYVEALQVKHPIIDWEGRIVGNKMHKAFPLPAIKFPLPEKLPTASENRVLVTKPHNKTPYELLIGRSPNIEFMKPSGCPVTILNILDHLGKFKGKDDEGILVGYSINRNQTNDDADDKDVDKAPEKGDEGVSKGSRIDDQERTDSSTQDVNTVGTSINNANTNINTGAEANTNNLELSTVVRPIPTTRVHKDHPKDQIIGDLNLATQTRRMINFSEENAMVSYINKHRRTNHEDYKNCLLASFLSQIEPNKVIQALTDPIWIEAIQEELLNKKVERRIVVRNKARLVIIPKKKALIMMRVHCVPNGCKECLSVWHNRRGGKDDGIFISQDKYVADILKKFDFTTAKTASTPMEPNKALIKDAEVEDVSSYTKDFTSLFYEENLQIFKRKSTTGGCQFLGKRLISWQCKKQTIVVNSTTEAEYVVAANCCGQMLWIQN
nr:retrotransposon protein, putative, unclassified [Tanacetum cinerariifolium]